MPKMSDSVMGDDFAVVVVVGDGDYGDYDVGVGVDDDDYDEAGRHGHSRSSAKKLMPILARPDEYAVDDEGEPEIECCYD